MSRIYVGLYPEQWKTLLGILDTTHIDAIVGDNSLCQDDLNMIIEAIEEETSEEEL